MVSTVGNVDHQNGSSPAPSSEVGHASGVAHESGSSTTSSTGSTQSHESSTGVTVDFNTRPHAADRGHANSPDATRSGNTSEGGHTSDTGSDASATTNSSEIANGTRGADVSAPPPPPLTPAQRAALTEAEHSQQAQTPSPAHAPAPPTVRSAYRTEARNDIHTAARNAGLNESQAAQVADAAAPVTAAVRSLADSGIAKSLPNLNQTLSELPALIRDNGVRRAQGGNANGDAGAAPHARGSTNPTDATLDHLAGALNRDLPGTNWRDGSRGVLDAPWASDPNALPDLLPTAVAGSHTGLSGEHRVAVMRQATDVELRALGVSDADISAIRTGLEQGNHQATRAMDTAFGRLDPDSDVARAARAEVSAKAAGDYDGSGSSGNSTVTRLPDGSFRVDDANGNEIGTVKDAEGAKRLADAHDAEMETRANEASTNEAATDESAMAPEAKQDAVGDAANGEGANGESVSETSHAADEQAGENAPPKAEEVTATPEMKSSDVDNPEEYSYEHSSETGPDFAKSKGMLGGKRATTRQMNAVKKELEGYGLSFDRNFEGNGTRFNWADNVRSVSFMKYPTEIHLFHEMTHVRQFMKLGRPAYEKLGKYARELHVFREIWKHRRQFNKAEIKDAM